MSIYRSFFSMASLCLIAIMGGAFASSSTLDSPSRDLYFFVQNKGPAEHFSTFYKELSSHPSFRLHFCASNVALETLREKGIEIDCPFSFQGDAKLSVETLASNLLEKIAPNALLMTEVGHEFGYVLQKACAKYRPDVYRIAYYDNPEPYVPTYSEIAKKNHERIP